MPTRIKQDRTRKAGYRGSLNIQDFEQRPLDAMKHTRDNLRTAYSILSGNMQTFGGKLTPEFRAKMAVVLANMESILR